MLTNNKTYTSQRIPTFNITRLFKTVMKGQDDITAFSKMIALFAQQGGSAIEPPKPYIKYPVFQGGGVKGHAYVGAYSALDNEGLLDDIVCAGGASAGAIVAFLMAMGFDAEQFAYASERLNFLDFTDFKKNGWAEYFQGNSIATAFDFIQNGAAFTGKNLHQWVCYYTEQILGCKNATFKDLHEMKLQDPTLKDLLVTATHYGTKNGVHALQVFSYESTPNVIIADAVRASMAFPGAFEPWEVHEKISSDDNTYELKSLGFFADGGILNNFPITCFNSLHYLDPQYPFIERIDQHGVPVQINPCSLGFSITSLDKLNKEITPFSSTIEKLMALTKQQPINQNQGSKAWHYSDLLKAVLWNTIGKPEMENVDDKQKLFYDQTVQIWPANVSTLEFAVTKEKTDRLLESGKEATKLWIDKFRDARDTYAYPDSFDNDLTKKEEKLRINNPEKFYSTQLQKHITSFVNEMHRGIKKKQTNISLLKNIRLRYFAKMISQLIVSAHDLNIDITKSALQQVLVTQKQYTDLVLHYRENRWKLLHANKIVDLFAQKLESNPQSALGILKGQLSNIVALAQEDNARLLKLIVQSNDSYFAIKAFKVIIKYLNHQYYQGRVSNPRTVFTDLLNSAKPSLISTAIPAENIEIITFLLSYGANGKSIRSGLLDAIIESKFKAFELIATFALNQGKKLTDFHIENNQLTHNIFKNASAEFIESFCNNKVLFDNIYTSAKDSEDKSSFHYLAQRGMAESFCKLVYSQLAKSESVDLFEKDSQGKSAFIYLLQNNRIDIIKQLVTYGKGMNKGYFWNADFTLDDVFSKSVKTSTFCHQLHFAYQHNREIYDCIVNNINPTTSQKLKKYITIHTSSHKQPVAKMEYDVIKQEPIIFSKKSGKRSSATNDKLYDIKVRLSSPGV